MKKPLREIVIGTGYIRAFFVSDPNFTVTKKDKNGLAVEGVYKETLVKVNNNRIAESVDEKELLSSDDLKELGIELVILDNPRVPILAYKRKNILYMIINDFAFEEFLKTVTQGEVNEGKV